ncbi:MAG: hypothetical protein R3E79_34165 [Caldilineaceae bacterium]
MTIVLENLTIPKRGVLELDLKQSIEIKVTAEEARRKVNRWLMDYVSYMMHADPPTLVVDHERAVWRVPAIFTAPQVGVIGTVGLVDVDVRSGVMDSTDERIEQIIHCAQEKAAKLPPYIPGQMKVPEQFIPKHIPRAKVAQLPEDDDE